MKTIISVTVSDVEKRRFPSKHYVYVVFVQWSDGGQYVIYRRYSRFFDLQSTLLDKFPIEAGTVEPTHRILPILPGKILFGRSHIREVAMKRLQPIDNYCKSLIAMPENISQCEEVLSFFEVEDDDLDPPPAEQKHRKDPEIKKISKPKQLKQYIAVSDYMKQEKGEINLLAGTLVELVEQSESGWWFVNGEDEQGWVPSTYLQPKVGTRENTSRRAKPGEEEKYICIDTFTASGEDELSLQKGAIVEVVEKNMEGWWLVRLFDKEGWAPATYLCKTKDRNALSLAEKGPASGVEIISTLSDISELLKQYDSQDWKETGKTKDPEGDLYSRVNKAKSLERGGSMRPPPRQNSVEPKTGMSLSGVPPMKTICSYITVAEFQDSVGDGISFKAGETVIVYEKAAGGWWYVEIDGHEGWAPSSYIKPKTSQNHSLDDDIKHSLDVSEASEDEDANATQPPYNLAVALKKTLDKKEMLPVSTIVSKPSLPPKKKTRIKTLMNQNEEPSVKDDKMDTSGVKSVTQFDKSNSEFSLTHTSSTVKTSVSSKCNIPVKALLLSKMKGEAPSCVKDEDEVGLVVTKLPTVCRPHIVRGNKPKGAPESNTTSPQTLKKLRSRPQLPATPKTPDTNNKKDVSNTLTDLKSKFEYTDSTSNAQNPQYHSQLHIKQSSADAESLSSRFNDLSTVSTKKTQIPFKKSGVGIVKKDSTVKKVQNAFEASNLKQQTPVDELKSVCASGNVSGLISALSDQLNFDEGPLPSKRPSCSPAEEKWDPSAHHHSGGSPVNICTTSKRSGLTIKTQSPSSWQIYTTKLEFKGDGEDKIEDREVVEVLDDSWWLIKKNDGQQGYVPASNLEKKSASSCPRSHPRTIYKAVCMFTAENEGEVGFAEGDVVDVIEKTDEGWWMVKVPGGKLGWAPSDFIRKEQPIGTKPTPPPKNQSVCKPVFKAKPV